MAILVSSIKVSEILNEPWLKIAKELGDKWEKEGAYGNLGNKVHLKIAKEFGDKSGEGRAILVSSIKVSEILKRAIDYHERDLKIAKELGDKSGEGGAYGNLGQRPSETSLGDFKTAIDYHERHLKIAKELGDKSGEGKGVWQSWYRPSKSRRF